MCRFRIAWFTALSVLFAVGAAACGDDTPSAEVTTSASVAPTAPTSTSTTTTTTAPTTRPTATLSWSAAPPLLQPRSAHGVVAVAGALYVLAGTGEDGTPILSVERFDGSGWAETTTLPGKGVNASSVAALDGRLYVIGGFTGTSSRPTDEVHVYDLATSTWTTAAPLPIASGGHAAVVLGDRIHVIGGGTARSTIADHVVYDPTTDTWTNAAPLPTPRGSPAAVVLDGQLWSIGGRSGRDDFGDVDIYDPTTDSWSPGPSIERRGTSGAVVVCGAVVVIGGESQADRSVLADVLRLTERGWQQEEPIPTGRSFARAVVLDGTVYVVGGSTTYGRSHASPGSNVVERAEPTC